MLQLFATIGCFIDSRFSQISEAGSSFPIESSKLTSNCKISPIFSANSLLILQTFAIDCDSEIEDLNSSMFEISGGTLKSTEGSGKTFLVMVEAANYSNFSMSLNEKVVFKDRTQSLNLQNSKINLVSSLVKKTQMVNTANNQYYKVLEGPNNDVFVMGTFGSWSSDLPKKANIGIYDQVGTRIEIRNDPFAAFFNDQLNFRFKFLDGSYLGYGDGCTFQKYRADGTTDPSFAPLTVAYAVGYDPTSWCGLVSINAGYEQADHKIVLGGKFGYLNGSVTRFGLVRLNANGTIDPTFVGQVSSNFDEIYQLTPYSDGTVFVLGRFSHFNSNVYINHFARIDSNGNLISTFANAHCCTATEVRNIPQNIQTGGGSQMFISGDGQIYITGLINFSAAPTTSLGLDKFDLNGIRDLTFNTTLGTGFKISGIATTPTSAYLQSDNKLVVATSSGTTLNGIAINQMARINSDGTLDSSFGFNPVINGKISLNASNQIQILHSMFIYDSQPGGTMARLDKNGNLVGPPTGFLGFNNTVTDFFFDKNNKMLAAGNFTKYGTTTINRIVRLNSDYSIDSSFNVGSGFNGQVVSILNLPSGNIFVGGNFTAYNGDPVSGVAILDSTGVLKNGLNYSGFTGGYPYVTRLTKNGKIAMVGQFTGYQGASVPKFIMLDENLNRSSDFSIDSSTASKIIYPLDICELQSGKLVVVGANNGFPTNGGSVIRVSSNGATAADDISFNSKMPSGIGTYDYLISCQVLKDDSIVVSGRLTGFQGLTSDGPIRITKNGIVDSKFLVNGSFTNGFITQSSPTSYSNIRLFNFLNFSLLVSNDDFNYQNSNSVQMLILNPL